VESIYQAIYDPAVALTRPARRRRRRRRLLGLQRRRRLTAMRMITERPPEAEDRVQAGHWEGDLIMGPGNRSAIGTLVERSTRLLILLPFPAAIATAEAVRRGLEAALGCLPERLRRTLTWDQGKELALHQLITAATGTDVFFCDAHAPWQRAEDLTPPSPKHQPPQQLTVARPITTTTHSLTRGDPTEGSGQAARLRTLSALARTLPRPPRITALRGRPDYDPAVHPLRR